MLFEKKTKLEAFDLSYKIVDEITNFNVKPVKLKFEKVYYPSILLAKKRYMGYMFETPQQAEPVLDVKGVEIIRRDGCQVSAKILERSVKILFEFGEVEKVKDYLIKQLIKLTSGKINLKDFVIAKEYRGREHYDNAKSIAACQVANKALLRDPLAEPLSGERVPYVIVCGSPGLPLYELVRSPHELIENPDLKLNYEYYVMKQILPPLDRIICLLGKNVFEWVKSMSFKPRVFQFSADMTTNNTISNFIYSTDCVLCGKKRENSVSKSNKNLCTNCSNLDQLKFSKLKLKFLKSERRYSSINKVCQLCNNNTSFNSKNECCSLDCPNTFLNISINQELKKTDYIRRIIDEFF